MTKTDRDLIQELMAVYARALDDRDYDGIAACFAPDAVVEYAGFSGVLEGAGPIAAHMRRALEPLDVTQHLFANFIIDVDRDTASLRCEIIGQHIRHDAPGGETYLSGGRYEVALHRNDGAWQFARLRAHSVWGSGNRELLTRPE